MARARARVSKSFGDFTRSDWELVIREAALGVEDTRIAELYLVDGIAHIDIGEEVGLSRSAVSKRMLRIIDKVERTARKLNIC